MGTSSDLSQPAYPDFNYGVQWPLKKCKIGPCGVQYFILLYNDPKHYLNSY